MKRAPRIPAVRDIVLTKGPSDCTELYVTNSDRFTRNVNATVGNELMDEFINNCDTFEGKVSRSDTWIVSPGNGRAESIGMYRKVEKYVVRVQRIRQCYKILGIESLVSI